MELRHLRYFLAVADELHFGRAAERLGIRQPPLSQQIRALEHELGVPLFQRTSRRVRLTAAGAALRPEAERALAAAEAGRAAARAAGRGDIGRLSLGFVGSATASLLPALLRALRARHPRVVLDLREMTTTQQADALRAGDLDVGILRPPLAGPDDGGLVVEVLAGEPLLVALPAVHRLAPRRVVDAADLADEVFVLPPRVLGPGLYDQIVAYCRRAGFEPAAGYEATEMHTIVSLVAAELGVSLVPASVARLRRPDVFFRALRPAPDMFYLATARRVDLDNPVALSLITLAHGVDQRVRTARRAPAAGGGGP